MHTIFIINPKFVLRICHWVITVIEWFYARVMGKLLVVTNVAYIAGQDYENIVLTTVITKNVYI